MRDGNKNKMNEGPEIKVIANRWKLLEKIGHGGFGEIHKAIDLITDEYVAIKMEKKVDSGSLYKEAGYYKYIAHYSQDQRIPKFSPKCIWFGKHSNVNVAVLELMGPSLSVLFRKCEKKFSLKTILMLADQMVDCIQSVHQCGIIHRDIKPGNFVIGGRGCENKIFIIDYGLSDFYHRSGKHIPFKSNCSFKGTYRYASKNAHFKIEQSRRDDLESLGYILIYFLKGKLPWQNLKVNKDDRKKEIGNFKNKLSLEKLTENLPSEFYEYMKYVRGLSFTAQPNYLWIKNLFRSCMFRHNIIYDYIFDWNQPQYNMNICENVGRDSFCLYEDIYRNSNIQNNKIIYNYNQNGNIIKPCNTIVNDETFLYNDIGSERPMSSSPVNFSSPSPYTTQTTILDEDDEFSLLGINYRSWENYDSPLFSKLHEVLDPDFVDEDNEYRKTDDNLFNFSTLDFFNMEDLFENADNNLFDQTENFHHTASNTKRKRSLFQSCSNDQEELPNKRMPMVLKIVNN